MPDEFKEFPEEVQDYGEIVEDSAGEWRWRFKSANHQILADSGEGYTRFGDALDAYERDHEQPYRVIRKPEAPMEE
jgi:uncharacterized protein YegP (UPF0339 family)